MTRLRKNIPKAVAMPTATAAEPLSWEIVPTLNFTYTIPPPDLTKAISPWNAGHFHTTTMSANQTQIQPLAERSPNTSPKKAQAQTDSVAKPHDQMATKDKSQTLQQEPESESKQMQSYISPSDTIMSPTTKKLEAIRGKRFAYVSTWFPPHPGPRSHLIVERPCADVCIVYLGRESRSRCSRGQ